MNLSNLLCLMLLTTLITFSSCTEENVTPVDEKIGTWKEAGATLPGLTGTYDVTLVYAADKSVVITVVDNATSQNLTVTTSAWEKNVSTNVELYKTTAWSLAGVAQTITDPYAKMKLVLSGSTLTASLYEAFPAIADAEANTTVQQTFTLAKQ